MRNHKGRASCGIPNGILGYTDKKADYETTNEVPIYLVFGDHTKTMNIATENFCVADNVKVLIPKINDIDALLYICTLWKKTIPDIGYARYWRLAKTCLLKLPIDNDGQINIEYMKGYITALKKKAIKIVVEYKDMLINKTKQVVGE